MNNIIGTSFANSKIEGFLKKLDKNHEEISAMILNYLRKNPEAGDTLEGIARWWLKLEMIEMSTEEVANALESLIQKRLIKMFKTKSGTTLYKINIKN